MPQAQPRTPRLPAISAPAPSAKCESTGRSRSERNDTLAMKMSLSIILGVVAIGSVLVHAPAALAQVPENRHPVLVGVDQAGKNVFYGEIAAVRLYDRALTAAELAELAKGKPHAAVTASKPV